MIPGGEDEIRRNDYVYFLVRAEDVPSLMLVIGMGAQRRQRVMVVGGGDVGSRVAELLEDTFKVTLIEHDVRRAEELSQELRKVELLHGDGADPNTLLSAGLLKMDTVITATGNNETNIMANALAKQMIRNQEGDRRGKEAKTVTLVQREQYLTLAAAMGSDIVLNKKVLAGDTILTYLREEMLSVAHLYGADAEVVELVAAPGAPDHEVLAGEGASRSRLPGPHDHRLRVPGRRVAHRHRHHRGAAGGPDHRGVPTRVPPDLERLILG